MSAFLYAGGHLDEEAVLFQSALAVTRRAGDRLGSLAEAARFRLLLVSGQPEPLADAIFGFMAALRGAPDLSALKEAESEFEVAVSAFLAASSERLIPESGRHPLARFTKALASTGPAHQDRFYAGNLTQLLELRPADVDALDRTSATRPPAP